MTTNRKISFLSKYNLELNEESLRDFLTYEFYFLSNSFSLCKRINEESKISVRSLDNYFKCPIIFTHSIVKALQSEKSNSLSLKEYVNGLLTIYDGPIAERIEFIFKMLSLNNDNLVHREDVSLILNYTHVFSGKKKQDVLQKAINIFFEGHSAFTFDKFFHRISSKHSDIFFIIMCFLFEYQNFNESILAVFETRENKITHKFTKAKTDLSQRISRKPTGNYKSTGNLIKLNTVCDLISPCSEVISYILENFNISMPFFKNKSNKEKENHNTSFDSTDSDTNGVEEEDIMDLISFENDILEAKEFFSEKAYSFGNFILPRGGSNYYTLKEGVLTSAFNSKGNSNGFTSTRSSFNQNIAAKRGSYVLSSFAIASSQKNISSGCILRKNTKKSDCSDFTNFNQGEAKATDHFSESIIFVREDNKQKRYTVTFVKDFLVVYKKRHRRNSCETNHTSNIKTVIPLRHLYVQIVEKAIIFNQVEYGKVILVSTATYPYKKFSLLFESQSVLDHFIFCIVEETNYVSMKNEFTYIKDIGKGAFCQIKLMKENRTNKLYSIKKLKKDVHSSEEFTMLNWEKDVITFLSKYPNLENIIKYYRVFESAEHIYIVMEYIPTGSLGNFIRKKQTCLSSITTHEIARQITNGVRELHEYGIVHRDLKLENILVDCKVNGDFQVKLIDFGLSQVITPFAKTKEPYGTPFYCAPEVLLHLDYNIKVDVWSIGIIAYYLEFATMPFDLNGKEKEKELYKKILTNKLNFPKKNINSREAKYKEEFAANMLMIRFISASLCKDFKQRPSIEGVHYIISKNLLF